MKNFFVTLFIKQNRWHRHSVLVHTIMVAYHAIRHKDFKFIIPALLHDIGKPLVAYQDEDDKIKNTYSFTDHEEKSYQIIKNWPFISSWSKKIVRYHYLIRDMDKSYRKGNIHRYSEKLKTWNSLDEEMREDLRTFLIYDDLGKGKNSLGGRDG